MTPLRLRMLNALRAKHYSPRTIEAYIAAVAHCARHYGRSPDLLTIDEIRQYLLMLRDEQGCSASRIKQVVSARTSVARAVLG